MVLAAALAAALLARGNDDEPTAASPDSAATEAAANAPRPPGSPTENSAAAVPADWVAYQDPTTGFSISHPPSWSVSTNGTLTDFRDPSSGAYLRVDHRQPPGPSPEGAWYDYEPTFAAQNSNYQRIRITPTTYQGFPAATWEFTYGGGGADLHAVDLGFIAGDYGFALNFQTPASQWDRMQPVFDAFKASFKAPAS